MRLDPTLEQENLHVIASDVEITEELLTSLETHPKAWSGLRAWVSYVRATGERPAVPAPSDSDEIVDEVHESSRRPRKSFLIAPVTTLAVGAVLWMAFGAQGAFSEPGDEPVPVQVPVPSSEPVPQPVDVLTASGDGFYCTATGVDVACVGSNVRGALGSPEQTNAHEFTLDQPVIELVAGGSHACARTTDHVYCWGDNRWGQIDLSHNDSLPPTVISDLDGREVEMISAGEVHTCAVTGGSDESAGGDGSAGTGQVWCWGSDHSGQLGSGGEGAIAQGLTRITIPPTRELYSTRFGTCAVAGGSDESAGGDGSAGTGQVWCWGANTNDRIVPGGPEIVGPTEVPHE